MEKEQRGGDAGEEKKKRGERESGRGCCEKGTWKKAKKKNKHVHTIQEKIKTRNKGKKKEKG